MTGDRSGCGKDRHGKSTGMSAQVNLSEALDVLSDYEVDAVFAARSVARRGSNSLLAEGETELKHPISDGRIIEAMRAVVASLGDVEATRRLWKRYPSTCAFYMIDAGRREYESGALYPRIADELGISVEQYINKWADHFIGFLDSLQLQRFDYDSAAKYKLESILLHGGLPDDAWRQVWENWILPGIRVGYQEPGQLMQWALSTAHDAPHLRTTTRDILDKGGLVVERLVREAVRAAVESIKDGIVDESADYGLPAAALSSLEEVLNAPRLRWPELRFDLESASLVFLQVPDMNLGRDGGSNRTSVDYDVFAAGESVKLIRSDEAVATNVTGQWLIRSFKIPLPASPGFEAIVRCRGIGRPDQQFQRRIRWKADGPQGVWTFMPDRRGGWICPPARSWRRPRNSVLYLVPPRMRLVCGVDDDACRVVAETPLTDDWGGWTAFQVEGAVGGRVRLTSSDGTPLEEWSLGRKCEISLEHEDDLLVGRLILDRLCPVFGMELPNVVVDALDPTLELQPEQWTCEVRWGAASEAVSVPFGFDEQGYRLKAVPQAKIDDLPDVIDDGLIQVSGPEGCGVFKRRFARVPCSRPRLVEIGVDDAGLLTARYEVESGFNLTSGLRNASVRVRREESKQVLTAPASLDSVAACFRDAGHTVSMNIALAGVSLEAEGIALSPSANPLVIPEAGLGHFAGAVLHIGASRGGGCTVTLELRSGDSETTELRVVGTGGSYSDALGFGELASLLPPSCDATLRLKVNGGGATFIRELIRIPRGLGLGNVRVDWSRKPARLVCQRAAAVPMSVRVLDLTAPWRDGLAATLAAEKTDAELEPDRFAFCEGRYGVWIEVADEWSSEVDLTVAPTLVFDVRPADRPDPLPPMGPYHQQLAQLLRSRVGLADQPRFRTGSGSLHMLEADAEATVATLLHCLHPLGDGCVGLLGEGESVAQVGRDIMRLEQYRNALSPATLRCLIGARSRGWTDLDALVVMTALRIPMSEVSPDVCALFEPSELQGAWELHPYVGLISSLIHSCAGEPDEAAECVDRWLRENVGSGSVDWLGFLSPDTRALRGAVDGCSNSSSCFSPLERALAEWIRSSTQKQQVHAAQWVREHLDSVRGALRSFRAVAGPLSPVVTAVLRRDCGEDVKTLSNLPLVSGALSLSALAQQVGHVQARALTRVLAGGDDPTHERLAEMIIQGLELCPDVLGLDLFLFRLWWSIETGDL